VQRVSGQEWEKDLRDLFEGGPIEFQNAWLRLSKGGLWELCMQALEDEGAREVLEDFRHRLFCDCSTASNFRERLRWFLRKIGSPEDEGEIVSRISNLLSNENDWSWYVDQRDGEEENIPSVTLQGLGVKGDEGFVVTLTLELREGRDKKHCLKVHPKCCPLPQDTNFKAALDEVEQWLQSLAPSHQPLEVTWQIVRQDGYLDALRGDSLGGLFAVGIWLLLNNFPPDHTITISAAMENDGKLRPVSGLLPKVRAAINNASQRIKRLLVADGQNLSDLDRHIRSQIQIQKVATVDEAIDVFITQVAPFIEMRKKVAEKFDGFFVSGSSQKVGWDCYEEPLVTILQGQQKTLPLRKWVNLWLKGEQKQWLLVAPSGMGKTTALRYITHYLASKAIYKHLLPIFMTAQEWQSVWERVIRSGRFAATISLENILAEGVGSTRDDGITEGHRANWWANWLERGCVVLLVDQVEQVATSQDFLEHISDSLKGYKELGVILAVRSEWAEHFRWLNLPEVKLEPLSEQQAKSLLGKLSRKLNKPIPRLPLKGDEFPPFLLTASLFIPQPVQGLGQTCLELVKVLLGSSLPLPSPRIIEILSTAFFKLGDKDEWSEGELYEALKAEFGDVSHLDRVWGQLSSQLLVRTDGSFRFVHTLLLETLRAFALKQSVEAFRFLTPQRAWLIASLLEGRPAQDFWKWLKRRAEGEPERWAEISALCLSERDDAPAKEFAEMFLSKWLDAFWKGKENERQGWEGAISALPEASIGEVILPSVRSLLTKDNPKLPDLRAAIHLMAIVAGKVDVCDEVDALASAFVKSDATIRSALAQDIATLFAQPWLKRFVDQLCSLANQSRQGSEALKEFIKVVKERT